MKGRVYSLALLLLVASCTLLAEAQFPANGAYVEVKWGNPLFPYGFRDWRGVIYQGSAVRKYRTGVFGLQYEPLPLDGDDAKPFFAVCIDASQSLFGSNTTQTYYVQTLQSYDPSSGDTNAPQLDPERKKLLQQLFTVGWAAATKTPGTAETPVASSGFQWAAWEIGREKRDENGALSLNLGTGDIYTDQAYTTTTGSDEVRSQANNFLNSITADTPETPLLIWSPVQKIDGTYRRVYGQEMLTPVPEAVGEQVLALLTTAVLVIVYRRRHAVA